MGAVILLVLNNRLIRIWARAYVLLGYKCLKSEMMNENRQKLNQ